MVEPLRESGFRVLRYDVLGHGFSYAGANAKYTLEELSTQLHELLEHVLRKDEPVDVFVGHSTSGVLGVQAALSLPTMPGAHRVKRLALISPAFWKSAGLMGKVPDRLPRLAQLQARARVFKVARSACLDNVNRANRAFAARHDEQCLRNRLPRTTSRASKSNHDAAARKFELHPQVQWAIFGILTRVMSAGVMAKKLVSFRSLVERQAEPRTAVGLFWGTMDSVVPFEHAKEVESWAGGDKVALVQLPGLGHESILEEPRRLAEEILKWAGWAVAKAQTGQQTVMTPRSGAELIFTPRGQPPTPRQAAERPPDPRTPRRGWSRADPQTPRRGGSQTVAGPPLPISEDSAAEGPPAGREAEADLPRSGSEAEADLPHSGSEAVLEI